MSVCCLLDEVKFSVMDFYILIYRVTYKLEMNRIIV